MNLRDLDYLRSVITHANFTRAAQAHGVSQAAISLAMQRLERELGFTLFERQGFRRVPTDRARSVASASAGIAESVRGLPQLTGRPLAGAAERTLLKAGLAPAAGLLYGAAMHRALRHGAPGQMLSVITGPAPVMLEQLQRGELDLVIAPQPRRFALKNLEKHVMYIGDPVIYARVGHALQDAVTLADVAHADWVVAGAAGTPGNVIEEAFRVRRWAPPRIAVQCPDYRMQLRLIAGSELLGVVSNATLVSADEQALVRPLSIREGLPRYDVCLFWSNPRASGNHGARAVITALLQLGATAKAG